ncbi:putative MFS-type transporter [Streptomyces aurantiacus JA 4570]|uniref:Putative MFS-type transporter n=1 Tax=Streptomyces aurantiacus JA 4570 TaxID=1286094 RepID=S3ZRT5_9ACTN|nr:putative MFS-type transporter [Streptomyces aurantiacus JA 4570]
MLCVGLYLLGLDLTVLNVAIPDLQADLRPTVAEVHWIVDGYALVLGGTVLAAGTVTDRTGRRLSYACGLTLCAAASVLGALAGAPWQLIAARCGMGAGAALMMPATLSLIRNLFTDPRERRRAIAVWTAVLGAGGLTGPLVGGWVVEHFSWRAVFWLNVPLALVTVAAAFLLVPESRVRRGERLDVAGALLSACVLLTLVGAVIEGPVRGWTSPVVLGGFALAAALLTVWARQQRRSPHPLLPPELLRDARIGIGALALALMSFALFGALFVMTLQLQGVMGHTPWEAGVRTVPLPAALAVGAFAGQPLIGRHGERPVVALGLVLVSLGLGVLATTAPGSGYGRLVLFQALAGLGAGMTAVAGTEAVMGAVPAARAGLGSAVNDATRQVGSALGVAVQGSLLATLYTDRIRTTLMDNGVPGDVVGSADDTVLATAALAARLPEPERTRLLGAAEDAFVHGLTHTALLAAAVTALTAAAVWRWFPACARDVAEYGAADPGGARTKSGFGVRPQ